MARYPLHCFEFASPALPPELWRTPRPPVRLFIRGAPAALELLARLPERGLAVVGTRSPQPRSRELTARVIAQLKGSGLTVISGLALGIDAGAHEAALRAGLPTIAILGGGLDQVYPPENGALAERILAAGGLLVSEYPPDASPLPHQFIMRNRLIASWAKATWVVEASHRSGALNTARWARDLGRTCLATPGYPQDPALLGNQALLDRDHAEPLWDAHSLGSAWLEFAGLGLVKRPKRRDGTRPTQPPAFASLSLSERLTREVFRQTRARGGVAVESLLEWSVQVGWTPFEFYRALQAALAEPSINDRGGFLTST